MKTFTQYFLVSTVVVLSLFIVNCGSSGGSSTQAVTATYGTACGAAGQNMVNSPWGCLSSCGYQSVYTGQGCQSYAGYAGGGFSGGNYACQGQCPTGFNQIAPNVWYPNGACMQQGTCTKACYGSDGSFCYPGLFSTN